VVAEWIVIVNQHHSDPFHLSKIKQLCADRHQDPTPIHSQNNAFRYRQHSGDERNTNLFAAALDNRSLYVLDMGRGGV
jgi:hypothetical protein